MNKPIKIDHTETAKAAWLAQLDTISQKLDKAADKIAQGLAGDIDQALIEFQRAELDRVREQLNNLSREDVARRNEKVLDVFSPGFSDRMKEHVKPLVQKYILELEAECEKLRMVSAEATSRTAKESERIEREDCRLRASRSAENYEELTAEIAALDSKKMQLTIDEQSARLALHDAEQQIIKYRKMCR